jgi:hypothetical protein
MKEVISVRNKAPGSGEDKRTERLRAAVRTVRLHKVKRTPGHHRAHFELRQQATGASLAESPRRATAPRGVAVTVEEVTLLF